MVSSAILIPNAVLMSRVCQALFRMVNPHQGCITIDGVKIGDIGLHDLRSHLARPPLPLPLLAPVLAALPACPPTAPRVFAPRLPPSSCPCA